MADGITSPIVLANGTVLGSAGAVALVLNALAVNDSELAALHDLCASLDPPAANLTLPALLDAIEQTQPRFAEAVDRLRLAGRRAASAYGMEDKQNPAAVWWPVPNHPTMPRRAVDELPWAKRTPLLTPTTPVGSAGSCFASEVAYRLQRLGYNYVVTQPNLHPKHRLHESCAKWGALFNLSSFRQLIERAYGEWEPPKITCPANAQGMRVFRDPWLEGVSYLHPDEVGPAHQALKVAAREAFDTVEVFIFTTGLAEVWRLRGSGETLARMPASAPAHLLEPHFLTYEENLAELERLWTLWRLHNPSVKLILTVSPIPLNASFQGQEQHVIAATCESKSILRAAAGAFSRRHDDVYYLPSYDLVSYCVEHPWTADGRHVTRATVDRVMELFERMFIDDELEERHRIRPDCIVLDQRSGLNVADLEATLQGMRAERVGGTVLTLISPSDDEAEAQRRIPPGLRKDVVVRRAPRSSSAWVRSFKTARLLVTRRRDPQVRETNTRGLVPLADPTQNAVAERLRELRCEGQISEVLAPLLHTQVAEVLGSYLNSRKEVMATGASTSPANVPLRRLFSRFGGQVLGAMHSVVQRNHPFTPPVPCSGVLGDLTPSRLAETVAALDRDGVVVWPTRLDPSTVARLREFATVQECLPRITLHKHGPAERYPGQQDASFRRYDFAEDTIVQSPDALRLAADPTLRAIAGAYLRCDPLLDFMHMWWSVAVSNPSRAEEVRDRSAAAQLYHWDLPKIAFLKVFVYLTDVTNATGPHCFVRGSHRKRPKALQGDGRVSDQAIANHFPARDQLELTGPAGTILVADTKGFHRGKALLEGERLLFQVQFSADAVGEAHPPVTVPEPVAPEVRMALEEAPRTYRHLQVR